MQLENNITPMNYELSKYSFLFKEDKKNLLYNSQSSFFAEIGEDLYETLYNRDFSSIPEGLFSELLEKKIIVDKKEQGLFYIREKVLFENSCHDQEYIPLVLVPTTDCNFNCPYCFEGEKSGKYMDDKIQDQIVEYLKKDEKLKFINITWFGGEPLMAFKILKSLYYKIKELEKEGKKITGQSIVTNGYLITDEVIKFINDTNVGTIQITIDGNKTTHDNLRCLKKGGIPTFDRILKNIKTLLAECPKLNVNVRVNVSRKNSNTFIDTYNELKELLTNNRIGIFPGFIREDTKDGYSHCYNSMDDESRMEFYQDLHNNGVDIQFIPQSVSTRGCMMQKTNSFIIGPSGELYKCWNDVNHIERAVGYINEDKIRNDLRFFNMLANSHQFSDQKCIECKLLPVCSGGCGWDRIKNIMDGGRYTICRLGKEESILKKMLMLSMQDKKGNNCFKIPAI